jgi:YVTN family beta-propeller protein
MSVITVISRETNTNITDIPVGSSDNNIAAIYNNFVYVTNLGNLTHYRDSYVSVISPENNTNIKNITVGENPTDIAYSSGFVYVANRDSNTISVISPENNTNIKNITVGDSPTDIAVDYRTNTIYVAHVGSDSISVIDGTTNKLVAGVTFQVNPFNSGVILCDGLTTPSPIGQYTYLYSGAQCIARPNEGFEFVSWEENLEGNSTQPIQVSRSATTWDSFVLAVIDFFGPKPDEPEATLNIAKFGAFTANFKELPPAIPSEYWIPLYGIIASTVVGWSIPSIIGWTKSKRDVKKLNYYHKQIASLYGDGMLDENDIEALDQLRSRVSDAYSEGKLNEKHYESLRGEISTLYEEIFSKKINLLNNDNASATRKARQEQLAQIKNEVEYAYSKGKINEKHYDLLTKAISNLDGRDRDTS